MDPTDVYRFLPTLLGVLSLSVSLSFRSVSQDTVPGRSALSITRDEPTGGLVAVVKAALERSHPGNVSADRLLEWLRFALRIETAQSKLPPYEQLVVIDHSGRLVAVLSGTSSSVPIDGALADRLKSADEHLVLVHNHPVGQGLAHDDLGQLTKPGVAGVIAVGNDGSLYAASLGKAYLSLKAGSRPVTVAGFILPGHPTVMTFVARARLEIERLGRKPTGIDGAIFRSHFDHLVGLALNHAGILQYRAVLGTLRRRSFDRYRDEFSHITEEAGRKVKAAMPRRRPPAITSIAR